MPQGETQPFQDPGDALIFAFGQQTRHDRVPGIERDSDRNRLAMVHFVLREVFELVGGPMPEIQRSGRSGLEWIATEPYLAHMQFRAILDQAIEMRRGELRQRRIVAFDPAKEIAVADQRDLDRLRHAGAFFTRRQTVDKGFLQRLWRLIVDEPTGATLIVPGADLDAATARLLHQTIAVVREDFAALRFHTAIARIIELTAHASRLPRMPRALAETLVLMVAPLAPHVAEELWQRLGHPDSLAFEPFRKPTRAWPRPQP